jgi:glycosyltransferase involved in cell wall biosynthesis
MPKVSVIIATHSRPHLLPRAVSSAFKAGTDVEVIVVDDASTDETASVCQSLKGIKYIRIDRNQNTAGARNIGIMFSSAEYVSFLDDDDIRLPNSLNEQLELLEANPPAGMVYGKAWLGDKDCNPSSELLPENCLQGDVFWRLIESNFILCLTAVFRKECIQRVGLLDKALFGVDDYDLWIRIAELFPVIALEKPVGVWRKALRDSKQGSSDRMREILRMKYVSEKSLNLPRALVDVSRREATLDKIQKRTLDGLLWDGAELLKDNKSRVARKSITTAVKLKPSKILRPKVLKLLLKAYLPVREKYERNYL